MVSEDSQDLRWILMIHRPVREDGAAETAFPIDETGNPSAVPESFLLIVRTERIFTTHISNPTNWL